MFDKRSHSHTTRMSWVAKIMNKFSDHFSDMAEMRMKQQQDYQFGNQYSNHGWING